MKKKNVIYLTNEELLELDGKCSSGVQKIINNIKHRAKIADTIIERIKQSDEDVVPQAITHCVICGDSVHKFNKTNGNTKYIKRLAGYYGGKDEQGKPILICEDCFNDYIKNAIMNK